MLRFLLAWLLLAAWVSPTEAAPPKPRPYTGSGVLMVRSSLSHPPPAAVVLYRDPGVGRIGEFPLGHLSRLTPVMEAPAGEHLLAVMGRKGKWLRIAYDDAGREGWLEQSRSWDYQPWDQFLRGRQVRLLPGLRKGYYILRGEPADSSSHLDSLGQTQNLRVIEIKGEWAMVMVGVSTYGWLRWRDDDGRFLIAVDARFAPQKH